MDSETKQVVLQELARIEDGLKENQNSGGASVGQDAEFALVSIAQLRSAVLYLTQTMNVLVEHLPPSDGANLYL